jgi:hypothetical protein
VRLRSLDGRFAVCRLPATEPLPAWFSLAAGPLSAAVRRGDELSLVCPDDAPPPGTTAERGWHALEVEGPMAFTLTGVLASIATPLADAGVPIFALATYDTDVVLVPGARAGDAIAALRAAGHEVR